MTKPLELTEAELTEAIRVAIGKIGWPLALVGTDLTRFFTDRRVSLAFWMSGGGLIKRAQIDSAMVRLGYHRVVNPGNTRGTWNVGHYKGSGYIYSRAKTPEDRLQAAHDYPERRLARRQREYQEKKLQLARRL